MLSARVLVTALVSSFALLLLPAPANAQPESAHSVQAGGTRSQESLDEALARHVEDREEALTALLFAGEVHAKFEGVRSSRLKSLGYSGDVSDLQHILPVPAFSYNLSAGFGASGLLWSNLHTGLDFAAPTGTPLVAVADGTVTDVAWAGPYGLRTILTLIDGTEIWYAHQLVPLVMPGQTVEIGMPIGSVGSSGNSTGPHVHLEVRPGGGEPVDPAVWLASTGMTP